MPGQTTYFSSSSTYRAVFYCLLLLFVRCSSNTNQPDYHLNNDSTSLNLYHIDHPFLERAHLLNNEKKYDSAIILYNAAAEKFRALQQWDNYVWTTGYIARLYLYVAGKDFHTALKYLNQSTECANAHLKDSNMLKAPLLFYWGLYYAKLNHPSQAIPCYNSSLAVLHFHKMDSSIYSIDNVEAIADSYFNQQYKNVEAEQFYLKAIKLRESLPKPACDSDISLSYYNLVTLYNYTRAFDKAQYYCQKALQKSPYIRNFRSYWIELLDAVAGHLFTEQVQYAKAIDVLQRTIQANIDNHGDKVLLSYYLTSLADVYAARKKYDSAIILYQQSLKSTDSSTIYEDVELQRAATRYELGQTLIKNGQLNEAMAVLKSSFTFRIQKQAANTKEIASTADAIAGLFLKTGQTDSALAYVQRGLAAYGLQPVKDILALPQKNQLDSTFWSYHLVATKAAILQKKASEQHGKEDSYRLAAMQYYQLADSLVRSFKKWYDSEEGKLYFTANSTEVYEGAIDCIYQLFTARKDSSYLESILHMAESNKSQLLLEDLQRDQFLTRLPISEVEKNNYHAAQQELSFLRNQLENKNPSIKDTDYISLSKRVMLARENLGTVENKMIQQYAPTARLNAHFDTIRIRAMNDYAATHNAIMVDYFWGKEAVYMIGFYNRRSMVTKIALDESLLQQLQRFQQQLYHPYSLVNEDSDFIAYQSSAYYLYAQLLEPLLRELSAPVFYNKEKLSLIVIPDGPIWNIPFEALVIDTNNLHRPLDYANLHYALRDFNISYAYSGKFLLQNTNAENDDSGSQMLAFSTGKNDQQADLPGAAREIHFINQYFNAKSYEGKNATKAVFKKQAPRFELLHLAVHGNADSSGLLDARLFFAGSKDSADDGILHSYELYGLPLRARLAVLSACESGTGKLSSGEGVYSMSRAFTLAGCQSVVSSLWQADDQATASIMNGFYVDLSKKYTVAAALSDAKRKYLDAADKRNAHPRKWGAFVAFGNTTIILSADKTGLFHNNRMVVVSTALLLLLLLFIILRRLMKKKVGRINGSSFPG